MDYSLEQKKTKKKRKLKKAKMEYTTNKVQKKQAYRNNGNPS